MNGIGALQVDKAQAATVASSLHPVEPVSGIQIQGGSVYDRKGKRSTVTILRARPAFQCGSRVANTTEISAIKVSNSYDQLHLVK